MPVVKTYICSGKLSELTNADCSSQAWQITKGCIQIGLDSLWTSCSRICNGVLVNGDNGRKCKDHCPDFVRESCQITTPTTEAPPTTPDDSTDLNSITLVVLSILCVAMFSYICIREVLLYRRKGVISASHDNGGTVAYKPVAVRDGDGGNRNGGDNGALDSHLSSRTASLDFESNPKPSDE